MNLTHPSEVKQLLTELDLRPSKVLGQNFLIDANILKIMLSTAHLTREDAVLEIGPGLGVLTEWLLRWSSRVVAIEKDNRLCAYLRKRFEKETNLQLIESDALDVALDPLLEGGVNKVVSNLPYSVGSRLIVALVESRHAPEQITVTVQFEVAQRLTAAPQSKDYGLISILAQLRYAIDIRKEISATCFYPPPEVKSAIVNLSKRPEPLAVLRDPDHFKNLVKSAFSHRRKQIGTVFRRILDGAEPAAIGRMLERLGIDPQARPETLAPARWAELSNAINAGECGPQ